MTDAEKRKRKIKIVTVGSGAVGKSGLLQRFATGTFSRNYEPNIFDNVSQVISVDGIPHEISLWDTAGQEDYERLRPLTYVKADAFLICFPVVDRRVFEDVSIKWYPEVRHHCPRAAIILVGTKADLRTSDEASVTVKEAEKLVKKIGAEKYVECSALENVGVKEVFDAGIEAALRPKVIANTNHQRCWPCVLI